MTYHGFETQENPQLAKAIKDKVFQSAPTPSGFKRSYLYYNVDLNGDGKPETLAYVMGDCGGTGGYPLLVLIKQNNAYSVICESRLVRQPIIVSTNKTKGWRDLIVSAAGNIEHPNIGACSHYVALKWTGLRYASNTNTPPATKLDLGYKISGDVILADIDRPASSLAHTVPLE